MEDIISKELLLANKNISDIHSGIEKLLFKTSRSEYLDEHEYEEKEVITFGFYYNDNGVLYHRRFIADTEDEAMSKAHEWILDKEANK